MGTFTLFLVAALAPVAGVLLVVGGSPVLQRIPLLAGITRLLAAATRMGFRTEKRGRFCARMRGTLEGLPVTVECGDPELSEAERRPPHLRITVDGSERGFDDLDLLFTVDDGNVLVGNETEAVALFDARIREFAGRGDRLQVKDGLVVFDSWSARHGPSDIEQLTNTLAWITRALPRDRRRLQARLLAQARTADEPEVRLKNLEHLLRVFRNHDATERALRAALTDAAPPVRFLAAAHLGTDGLATLLSLVRNKRVTEDIRRRALSQLAKALHGDELLPLLDALIDDASMALAGDAIALYVQIAPRPRVILRLVEAALDTVLPTNALAIVEALEAMGGEDARSSLETLLNHPNREVKVAAVDALGRTAPIGGLNALRKLSKKRCSAELRLSIGAAVALIRDRTGIAGAGELSFPEIPPSDGELSYSPKAGLGDLSFGPVTK